MISSEAKICSGLPVRTLDGATEIMLGRLVSFSDAPKKEPNNPVFEARISGTVEGQSVDLGLAFVSESVLHIWDQQVACPEEEC